MTERWFVLDINPEPWAIGPVGYSRRGGKMSAYVGRNQQLDAYKNAIKETLGEGHDLIEGKVRVRFWFWRNRAEYTTPQARTHRKHEADVTNMQKATEDALQGVLFKNDKDVNDIHSVIVEQGPEVEGRIVIMVEASHDFPDVMAEFPAHISEVMDNLDGQGVQDELEFDDDKYTSAPDMF